MATEQSQQLLPSEVIQNPTVLITQQHVEITGMAKLPNVPVLSAARVVGEPILDGERLRFKVTSIEVNGIDMTESLGPSVESAINDMFARLLRGTRTQSFTLTDGSIKIVVLEQ